MRLLACLALLCSLVASSDACPTPSFVVGTSRMPYQDEPRRVPPRPRLFFHLGRHRERSFLPRFSRDAENLAYVPVQVDADAQLYYADLDVAYGTISAEIDGQSLVFVVDTTLTPATRSVTIERDDDQTSLDIESDALAFRVESSAGTHVELNEFGVIYGGDDLLRVTALYANREESVIYAHDATGVQHQRLLLGILLAAAALLTWLVARGPASGRHARA